jgi:2-polyprenyl-6-methoxyphenol hydroxylase-like FAD-dependent oxidoreductase
MTAPYRSHAFDAGIAPLHIVVIGGGIGGLCLAQGLKKAGMSVAVYERDRTLTDRLQGYRVHINLAGSRALHACLPPHLFDAFDRTCGKAAHAMHFLTEQMEVLLSVRGDMVEQRDAYETRADGRIVAHFEDGTHAEGDILVAADGGGSRVRRQLLPQAERIDTGVVGIAGKVFLDGANRRRIAPTLLDGMALVAAKGGLGLFVALQELSGETAAGIGGNDASLAGATLFDNTRSYLMWALSGRRDALGLDGERPDGAALAAAASRAMAPWAPGLRDLVVLSDQSTLSCLPIRTSRPIGPWPTGRITLVGDAIHAMTPYRGIGANIALKDADGLRDALVAAQRGEKPLFDAINGYESAMRDYGFKAVGNSLKAMQQVTGHGRFALALSRAGLRLVDRLPPVKRMMARGMGKE